MTKAEEKKLIRPCLNPEASEAGWIIAFCNCPLCLERREKTEGKSQSCPSTP